VVFADAEEVEPEAVGELGFSDDVAEDGGVGEGGAGWGDGDVTEGAEAQFDGGGGGVGVEHGSIVLGARVGR